MRRPIQQQLLVPMLIVVLAGVAVASLTGAWMGARIARDQEQESIRRLAGTLADAGFPLSENVLQKMSGLSGADFVVIGPHGEIQRSTISLSAAEASRLLEPGIDPSASASKGAALTFGPGRYHVARLPKQFTTLQGEFQTLYVLYPEEHWNRMARRAALPPLIAGFAAAVVAVGVTAFVSRRFTTRVLQLSRQASAVAGGTFQTAPLPRTDDELRDLAQALNQMSEQLVRYEEQVRRSERLRTLGQLGAGIAHQMRNSATGALMALELHASEMGSDGDRESLDVAVRQLKLMETSLKRFLQLGRGERSPTEDIDLASLISETAPLVEPASRHANIRLEWNFPQVVDSIAGELDALRQLLLNLLMNAIEAATNPSGQPGLVRIELVSVPPDGTASARTILRVLDSGPGPDASLAERLFEPFVTSKPDGTGLGLFVAREICQAHHAELRWRRTDGMTCFEVAFP